MARRLLLVLVPAAVFAAGCGGDAPGTGAARAVIAWHDFAPRCLRLTAKPASGDPKVSEVALDDEARNGQRVIAVFRAEGWDADVALTAQAFEGSCAAGTVVAQEEQTAHIGSGVVEIGFELTAKDVDKDGFVEAAGDFPGTDCADTDAAIHPGVAEACNMQDDNCDGAIDEGVKLQLYWDGDHDGFGAGELFEGCSAGTDWVANDTDCDDERADVHPGAPELCNGIDDDCSGAPDEGLVLSTFYADDDGDGFGDPAAPIMACVQGPGMVTDKTDCDDDPLKGGATAHPGGTEVCDGWDNDCDGSADEGLRLTFFVDADGDGFGDDAAPTLMACSKPDGYSDKGGDCDDTATSNGQATFPGATETCNMRDDDCDGQTDEGVKLTFHEDVDGDTYGDLQSTIEGCAASPGWVADATDCDDTLASVHPGATEACNTVDDDCDGAIDEGVKLSWYRDADADTWGNPNDSTQACTQPMGYVQDNTDCNDSAAAIHPMATEACNYADDNCNGQVDEGVKVAGFFDLDFDGTGGAAGQGCTSLPGFVTNSDDCDDGNPFNFTGNTEVCDNLDNDCDGTADNGAGCGSSGWVAPGGSGGNNQDYYRLGIVSTGAWAAGEGGLRYFPSSNVNATNFDSHCSGASNWHAAAANYVTGTGYFGDDASKLGAHTPAGAACAGQATFQVGGSNVDLRGMAFINEGSTPTVYGITVGGHVFRWDVSGTTTSEVASVAGTFYDFDGLAPNWAFAVGSGPTSPTRPFIARATSATTWAADTIDPAATFSDGEELRAVSVALSGVAAAAGDNGIVLVRDPYVASGPVQWKKLPVPSGAGNLLGVKCFGKNLIYVVGTGSGGVTTNGYGLWRWDGTAWTGMSVAFSSGKTPRDIDGSSPSDLWIVGLNGFAAHWTP